MTFETNINTFFFNYSAGEADKRVIMRAEEDEKDR
jgi:hypothetical protein